MLHNDPYSDYNYYGSQVYVPAKSSGPSTVQFVHPYANCCGALEPAAIEESEASTGTVEVATASAGVEQIQGRKK